MKVMLPIDSTSDAEMIVDFVGSYRWPIKTSFQLFHVIGCMASEEEFSLAENDAVMMLGKIGDKVKTLVPDADTNICIASGDAALEIISAATTGLASMIVMGYRVRSDIKSLMAGSVSRSVAVQAPCSVVVLRPAREVKSDIEIASLDMAEAMA